MDEQDKKEKEKEPTTEDTGEGDEPERHPAVIEADEIAKGIKAQVDRFEKLTIRNEKLAVERTLSGRAEAGTVAVEEKELDPVEFSKAIMRGEINPLGDVKEK